MTNAMLCTMLNDRETNLLADLFLDFLGLDKSTNGYRHLRNAVIAAPAFADGMPSVYAALGEIENVDPEHISNEIEYTLKGVDIAELFNAAYSTPDKLCVKMQELSADDAILFLATVFAYIKHANYNG